MAELQVVDKQWLDNALYEMAANIKTVGNKIGNETMDKLLKFPEDFNATILNLGTKSNIDWNEVLNKYGIGDYEFQDFIYTQNEIINSSAFQHLNADNIFITQLTPIPEYAFQHSQANLLWLGNYDKSNPAESPPSASKIEIGDSSFLGMSNLRHFIINSSLSPTEAFSCEATSFQGTLLSSFYTLYVPDNKVAEWEEEIYSITNFYDYPSEILPISNLFVEGGPLYDSDIVS